jgi:outer membrane protein OmpA-like peptidoglycan-associated protein
MKKILYTVAFFLASAAAVQAQKPIKEARDGIASLFLLENDILVYTRKEADGQFLYTEKKGQPGTAQKDAVLNAGSVNSVIGTNPAANEVFVYQKTGRREEMIAIYRWEGGGFTKVEERRLPKMRNNSANLGLFLTKDKGSLFVSGELKKSKGYDDIYVSKWEGGRWTKPASMGASVNTRLPEFAPSVANDSLFFSRKQGHQAYVYAVPLGTGGSVAKGESVKAKPSINQGDAFNAYYSRTGEKETWVTSAVGNNEYTAYLSEAKKPAPAPVPVREAARQPERPEAAAPAVVAPVEVVVPQPVEKSISPDLKLFYGYNKVFLEKKDMEVLAKFLAKQKAGAKLTIKGYSDNSGNSKGKWQVSQKRASYVKWYIDRHFSSKNFTVETENIVSKEKGQEDRKTELFVHN